MCRPGARRATKREQSIGCVPMIVIYHLRCCMSTLNRPISVPASPRGAVNRLCPTSLFSGSSGSLGLQIILGFGAVLIEKKERKRNSFLCPGGDENPLNKMTWLHRWMTVQPLIQEIKSNNLSSFIAAIPAFMGPSYFPQTHWRLFLCMSLSLSHISGPTDRAQSRRIFFSPPTVTNDDITFKSPLTRFLPSGCSASEQHPAMMAAIFHLMLSLLYY